MIKTILVPTDGSEPAAKAVGCAADPAEKYGAKVHQRRALHGPRFVAAHKVCHLARCSCITVR